MAETFASFAAKVDRFGKELGDDALGHAIGKMAKDEAKKAAAAETPPEEVDVRSRVAELRSLMADQQAQQQAAMEEIEGLLTSEGR
jgi:hypothetical protein